MSVPQAIIIKQGTDFVSKHPYLTAGIVVGAIAIGGLIFYYYVYKPFESFAKFLEAIGKGISDAFNGLYNTTIGSLNQIPAQAGGTTTSIAYITTLPEQQKTEQYLWGGAAIQRGSH